MDWDGLTSVTSVPFKNIRFRVLTQKASTDSSIFSPHFARAAATSKAAKFVALTSLKTVGWRWQSTLTAYYYKPIMKPRVFGQAVLHWWVCKCSQSFKPRVILQHFVLNDNNKGYNELTFGECSLTMVLSSSTVYCRDQTPLPVYELWSTWEGLGC